MSEGALVAGCEKAASSYIGGTAENADIFHPCHPCVCAWALHGEFVLTRNKAKAVNDHVYVPVHVHVKVHVLENLP